ncbi:MAG: OadG family transporter subunit [Tissierellia bacterium]|nr:OadG family transporter subunit [Tissierellia bacterium]
MNASALLEKLASGADLTTSEKLLGGSVVTVLAMAIVFLILILLIVAIVIMGKVLHRETPTVAPVTKAPIEEVEEEDPYELVAVITAAVSEMMGTSQSNIKVKRIQRVGRSLPTWATTGTKETI